jgi:hypothetical protein
MVVDGDPQAVDNRRADWGQTGDAEFDLAAELGRRCVRACGREKKPPDRGGRRRRRVAYSETPSGMPPVPGSA